MIDYAEERLGQGPSNSVRGMEKRLFKNVSARQKPPLQAAVQVLVY